MHLLVLLGLLGSFLSLLPLFTVAMSSSGKKVALVTGANKGIGKEIARGLLHNSYRVILGCRNVDAGRAAAAELGGGENVAVHQLDISDSASIARAAAAVTAEYGALDVLVNNAAIAFKGSDPTPFAAQAAPTMETNFHGTVACTAAFLPLLLKSADQPRIVNIASQAGHLDILPSRERRQAFESASLTLPQLEGFMREFVADVQNGQHSKRGWPNTCYGTSKLAVVAYTRILAREHPGVLVNACCPGYCATDMSSHRGTKTAAQGAQTPLYLATQPPAVVGTGGFWVDERKAKW